MTKRITISQETYDALKDQILAKEAKVKGGLVIKSRSGSILYRSSKDTIKEALEEAVASGTYLREANLRGADLREANLREANLWEADLWEADLRGADLMNCKFYGKGGTSKLKRDDVDTFLAALGFIVED